MTKFQRASNCNEVNPENSLGEKILVFASKFAYNFNLIENAKELSYELQILIQSSSEAPPSPLQTASSYSNRKHLFEALEIVLVEPPPPSNSNRSRTPVSHPIDFIFELVTLQTSLHVHTKRHLPTPPPSGPSGSTNLRSARPQILNFNFLLCSQITHVQLFFSSI